MDIPMLDSLNTRIDQLERQNRSVKRLTAVLFFVITALVVTGISVPRKVAKEIEAERFILRDASGKIRASLGFSEDERMGLTLFDKSGKNRIWLGVLDKNNTVSLALRNQKGKLRVGIGVTEESSMMIVYGKDEKANLLLDTVNGANISLIQDGNLRGQFGANNGDVGMTLFE